MKETIKHIQGNLRRGPVTTIVGIVIILASIASVFLLDDVSWMEAAIALVIGLLVAFAKDPKGKQAPLLLIGIGLLTLSSCYTKKGCLQKVCPQEELRQSDSVRIERIVERKDSIITLPGDTTQLIVEEPCDSLGNLKDFEREIRGIRNSVATIQGKDNTLTVDCKCEEEKRMIKDLRTKVTELRDTKQSRTEVRTVTERFIPWYARWQWLIAFVIAAYLLGVYKIHLRVLRPLFTK